ncbi:MAG: hypothetical protein R3F59_00845 [Myxococcota bacterium]
MLTALQVDGVWAPAPTPRPTPRCRATPPRRSRSGSGEPAGHRAGEQHRLTRWTSRRSTQLVIPANSQLAQVLAKQSLQYTATGWTNDRNSTRSRCRRRRAARPSTSRRPRGGRPGRAFEYDVDPGSLANAYISCSDYTSTEQGASAFTFGSSSEAPSTAGTASDFTFGRTEAQTFGDCGEPGDRGQRRRRLHRLRRLHGCRQLRQRRFNPLAQGATAEATGYGGYGDSSGTFGGEGSSGNPNPTSGMADAINAGATPAEQGALSEEAWAGRASATPPTR